MLQYYGEIINAFKKYIVFRREGAIAPLNLAGGRVARHAEIIKNQHIFILNNNANFQLLKSLPSGKVDVWIHEFPMGNIVQQKTDDEGN
ncbi:hypothetical protein AAKU55_003896 [Oxalobacteraceae bacterium GrIS 1.11]